MVGLDTIGLVRLIGSAMNSHHPTWLERGAVGRALWALFGILVIWATVAWALA